MKKLLVANWKENPMAEKEAMALFTKTAQTKRDGDVTVTVCPPFIYLEPIAKKFSTLRSKKNLTLGAQDVFWQNKGAYTGGEGPLMLKSLGVETVIIGHSERRKFFHETDAMVSKKIQAALAGGLTVILCVGETLSVRKKGLRAAQQFIKNQLKSDLKNLYPIPHNLYPPLLIAYEPIWAIGTGKSDSPADAESMALFIKKTLKALCPMPYARCPLMLYGGSVNAENIIDYVSCKSIDGALVGGASLNPKEFGSMIKQVGNFKSKA